MRFSLANEEQTMYYAPGRLNVDGYHGIEAGGVG